MNRQVNAGLFSALALVVAVAVWAWWPHDGMFAARWAWLPGTALGCLGGTYGALIGWLAPKGVGRRPLLAAGYLFVAVGAGSLLVGLAYLVAGHPYHLWYPWLLSGVIGVAVLGPLLPVIRRRFEEAEMRKLESRDIALR